MRKRIDTFDLDSALGIYMSDITLISVLKDNAVGPNKQSGAYAERTLC